MLRITENYSTISANAGSIFAKLRTRGSKRRIRLRGLAVHMCTRKQEYRKQKYIEGLLARGWMRGGARAYVLTARRASQAGQTRGPTHWTESRSGVGRASPSQV